MSATIDNKQKKQKQKPQKEVHQCECGIDTPHIASMHAMWKEHSVEWKSPKNGFTVRGISEAAKITTLVADKTVVLDAGFVPNELGTNCRVLLLTHGHSDHAKNMYGVITDDSFPTIFCPQEICQQVWNCIKSNHESTKGRVYTADEMKKCFTLIGVKDSNKVTKNVEEIHTVNTENMTIETVEIAKLISYGESVMVSTNDKGNQRIMIQAFKCTHSVPTVGYVVSNVTDKIADTICLPPGTQIKINLDEDRIKNFRKSNDGGSSKPGDTKVVDDIEEDRFKDINDFSAKYGIKIIPSVIETILESGFPLRTRILDFPEGLNINTFTDGKCILQNKQDRNFFEKYEIRYNVDCITPNYAFFGDTDKEVFKSRLVQELISNVKTIIIECTFMEGAGKTPESLKIYNDRKKKYHMFLDDIIGTANKYKHIDFLLIHFSSCYNNKMDMMKSVFTDVKSRHSNIFPFLKIFC